MRNYQKLTPAEKNINRLRKAFEKNMTPENYLAWRQALDAFVLTREGAAEYRRIAKKTLVDARFFPESTIILKTDRPLEQGRFFRGSTKVYRNGYEFAVSKLYNAELLDRIVAARERVNADALAGLELSPPPLPHGA